MYFFFFIRKKYNQNKTYKIRILFRTDIGYTYPYNVLKLSSVENCPSAVFLLILLSKALLIFLTLFFIFFFLFIQNHNNAQFIRNIIIQKIIYLHNNLINI
jgi:hypothetical protein